jgi:hypothetical protein
MPFKRYITTQFKYNNSSSRYDLVNIYLQRKGFRCVFRCKDNINYMVVFAGLISLCCLELDFCA